MAFEKAVTLDDLPVGTAGQVELGGEPICVVRLDDDTVRACHDTCSHEEYPLHEGWIGAGEVECALHGSTFDLETGEALSLPAVTPIPVYAAKIEDHPVWGSADQQLTDARVPRH